MLKNESAPVRAPAKKIAFLASIPEDASPDAKGAGDRVGAAEEKKEEQSAVNVGAAL